jgi:cyclophilin family peptidyl-prolyl cis-trans isomerase/HEAT repeat protein
MGEKCLLRLLCWRRNDKIEAHISPVSRLLFKKKYMQHAVIRSSIVIFTLLSLFACKKTANNAADANNIKLDYNDLNIQKILSLQDRQKTDSLLAFLKDPNVTNRYLATTAFASIQDKKAINDLAALLKDPIDDIRTQAAFALGQIGDASAEQVLITAFQQYDATGESDKFNATVLEAIGKCGTATSLKALSTISTYQPKDTALLEGQAYALFRFMQRNIHAPEAHTKIYDLLASEKTPNSVKMIAATYLARTKEGMLDSTRAEALAPALARQNNADVKMAMIAAIGKARSRAIADTLTHLLRKESDYRVKCNILKALQNQPYYRVQEAAFGALRDANPNVAASASDFFLQNGLPKEAWTYWMKSKDSTLNWRTQTTLLAAANRHMPNAVEDMKENINAELRRRASYSNNIYECAASLKGLAEFGWNYPLIRQYSFSNPSPIIRSAGVEALADLCRSPRFDKIFTKGATQVRGEIVGYFKEAILSGDAGMVAAAAEVLREPTLKNAVDTTDFLVEGLKKLKMPRDAEAYIQIQKTLNYFAGKPDAPTYQVPFNHSADWKSVGAGSKATIKTSKGNITMQFLTVDAPATITNFIKLSKEGFFNGKIFHRAVPNFVIQSGCPRGDGYGSLDYTIRSEFSPTHYDSEGFVGMASAGKDTEATQFFITQSPSIHLDGKYTIFAKVINGMDVVNKMEVGDKISGVTIE